jgi:hypothetical protein
MRRFFCVVCKERHVDGAGKVFTSGKPLIFQQMGGV